MASWVDVYARFGAKPNRAPCSAQALKKRVERDGVLPPISPLVDLYNAVSLRYAVPVGGENFDPYVGTRGSRLRTEPFDTVMNGKAVIEYPVKGEDIWRDDAGVTCRRWNWRQGSRTRLDKIGGEMWFILESLSPMPEDALDDAADMFVKGLRDLASGCSILVEKLSASV